VGGMPSFEPCDAIDPLRLAAGGPVGAPPSLETDPLRPPARGSAPMEPRVPLPAAVGELPVREPRLLPGPSDPWDDTDALRPAPTSSNRW
jgi:hypothetical protein